MKVKAPPGEYNVAEVAHMSMLVKYQVGSVMSELLPI